MKAHSKGITIGLLLLAAVLFAACGQDPVRPDAAGPTDKYSTGMTGYCNPSVHAAFEDCLDNDEGIMWQLAAGVINCETGGELVFSPPSWGPGYEVKLVIPDHAVSPTYPGYPDIFFSIAIPVHGPNDGRNSVPYEFGPDGIHFLKDVTLSLCWPPWLGSPSYTGYQLLNIVQEIHENQTHYRVRELKTVSSAGQRNSTMKAVPDGESALWATGLDYMVDHFSRWEVVNGDGPDGVLPPDKIAPVALEAGTRCWTDLPPDPEVPIRLIR